MPTEKITEIFSTTMIVDGRKEGSLIFLRLLLVLIRKSPSKMKRVSGFALLILFLFLLMNVDKTSR